MTKQMRDSRRQAKVGGARARGAARTRTDRAAPLRKLAVARREAAQGRSATRAAPPAVPRIARIAKGKRPQYFSDPAVDKLLSMTLTLMEELSVTRDRLDSVERLLEAGRVLPRLRIEEFVPDATAAAERAQRRQAYVDRVLRAAQAELEEIARRDMPKSEEEAVAAVAG